MSDRGERRVRLYFDFVSPYSYLALTQIEAFGAEHGIDWELRPVVYGVLLDATGLVGPAEVDIKRRYTFHDIRRSARLMGVSLVGPPAHPFRSLEALRAVCLFDDDPAVVSLAVALAHACWGAGGDLTDLAVVAAAIEAAGLDSGDLGERLGSPEVKESLRQFTAEALEAGVFGVPSFVWEGEIFWGHDRLSHLALRLSGELEGPAPHAEEMLARPRGIDREGSPAKNP